MAAPTALPTRITQAVADAAHTYYVDGVSGSDASGTPTNPATPWKSIGKAVNTGGITIPSVGSNTPVRLVVRGTGMTITDTGPGSSVPSGWTTQSGVSASVLDPNRTLSFPVDSPLTITNYPGERVLIPFEMFHGGDTNIRYLGTPVNGRRGLVVDLMFPGGVNTIRGMVWIGCTNMELCGVEIRNTIWNALGGGIYIGAHATFGPTNNPIIWNSYIHHNGGAVQGGHGVYWGGTTSGQAVGINGGGIVNSKLLWNMDDNLSPHNCSIGSVFAHNLLLGWGGGWTGSGVSSTPLTDSGGTRSFTDGLTFFAAPSGTQSRDNILVNSILAFNKVYGLNQFDASSGGGNVEKNNCYFGNGTGAIRDASNSWSLLSTLKNNDPLFVGRSVGDPSSDFHLQNASPCISRADIAFVPPDDFDFNTRTGNDIGPYASAGGTGGGGGGSSYPVSVGDVSEGATFDSGYSNARAAMQVVVPTSGINVQEIRCWIQTFSAGATARVGIYDDASGAPGNLLVVSGDFALTISTIDEFVFPITTPIALVPGATVWLAIGFDAASPSPGLMVNDGTHVYSFASGALPSSFGAVTVNSLFDMAIAAYGTALVVPPSGTAGRRTMMGAGQ